MFQLPLRKPPSVERHHARSRAALKLSLAAVGLTLSTITSTALAQWPPPPSLPPAPPGSTCVLLRRGSLGAVQDADLSQGNGNWAAGAYPYTWTGPSPYDHWSLYKFDLSVLPASSQVVLAAFSTYVSWNDQGSTVRIHRIKVPWEELTVAWPNFGGAASWDSAVEASFNPSGVGYKTVDVTPLVQGWQSGAFPNHGLLMEENPVKLHAYFASESGTLNQRPNLYVCYVAGGPCAGKAEGAACNDNNLCTTGETCHSGQCAGEPVVCAPLDQCHEAGVCDVATGQCTTPEKQDGAPCDDADPCTTNDLCVAGLCMGPDLVSCSDGNACTNDVCVPNVGCVESTVSCDDNNACTVDSCDAQGGCTHEVGTCDDGDACTADACDPVAGCVISPISCDDGNPCTVDGCQAQTGCFHTAAACDDNNACTADSCDPVSGCAHAPIACDDNDTCTVDACDPVAGCTHAGGGCSDGLACTVDACDGAGGCKHTIACPPGQPCSPDFCASAQGQSPQFAWICGN